MSNDEIPNAERGRLIDSSSPPMWCSLYETVSMRCATQIVVVHDKDYGAVRIDVVHDIVGQTLNDSVSFVANCCGTHYFVDFVVNDSELAGVNSDRSYGLTTQHAGGT